MKYKCLKSVLFQYILCYGSTDAVEVRKTAEKNFNTSYVTVQHFILCYYYAVIMNFNTSYVTVQRIQKKSINYVYRISIHLMLRFN